MGRRRAGIGVGFALAASALAAIAVAVPAAASGVDATAACGGRSLLTCSEKVSIYDDGALAAVSFELDSSLFELHLPVHFSNPALARYWRFEVSAVGVLSVDDVVLIDQIPDPNFELVATTPRLAAPTVSPSGVIDRRVAREMNAQMADEQTEVLNVSGMLASLDRATAASFEAGRSDWVAYQTQLAGGFSARAAAAVKRLIGAQRTVARAFTSLGLRFGIGALDERLTRADVRRHGLTRVITAGLRRLGATSAAVTELRDAVEHGNIDQTYNLAVVLDDGPTVSDEQAFEAALTSFARGAPHGLAEPS